MSKTIAFSYSRLNSYETCPKKYYAVSVAKSAREKETEHTAFGTEMHLAFANFFKHGKRLPLHLTQYEKYLTAIKQYPGQFIVEQKLAINTNYEATGWFDEDVYCRIISDLTILNGDNAVMFDWKSGRVSSEFTQLRLAGAVMFLLVPELQKITLAYFWTKNKSITKETMTREETSNVWSALLPRIGRYQEAHVALDFPAKPNGLCRYCPVTSCPYQEAK